MQTTMHLSSSGKKLRKPSGPSPFGPEVRECIARFTVFDKGTQQNFLIYTGADVSVLPALPTDKGQKTSQAKLFAANGTPIKTYGTQREFAWTFILADVTTQIIRSDFLSCYGLLVDVKRQALKESTTLRKFQGITTNGTFQQQASSNDVTVLLNGFMQLSLNRLLRT